MENKMKTRQEILDEIERLNKLDEEMCDNSDAQDIQIAIEYFARREALLWVLNLME